METADRKLQVVMKEWEDVETFIQSSMDAKFKIRQWSITLFSGVLALAAHQGRASLIFIAIATTLLFSLLDALRRFLQNVAISLEHEIEAALRNPTDDDLAAFEAPLCGREFGRRET